MKPQWLPVLLFILNGLIAPAPAQNIFPITRYGAVSDGKTVNTAAINQTIQACGQAGGGTVLVPTGTFLTGTVRLLDNVNLHLEAGAVLKGSPDVADYELDGVRRGLIFAFEARNISITGLGEVHGNGDAFHNPTQMHLGKMGLGFERSETRQGEAYLPEDTFFSDGPISYEQRPDKMVQLYRCERVIIRDVLFSNSPEWTFRIGDCDNVLVDGITINDNLLIPNSDGIHCTTSRNVRIANCTIRCGDDSICVTGFGDETGTGARNYDNNRDYHTRRVGNRTGYAENVTVSNCVLQSRSAGIRVGYGDNPIRNCVFENIVIYDSNRGIGVFNRDRADIENILFQNIVIETRLHNGHWWGKGEPIHVSSLRQNPEVPVGRVRNIRFAQIEARSQTGIVLWGEAGSKLEDISMHNIHLRIEGGPLQAGWGGNFDLRPSALPGKKLFKHDIPGVYAQHVNGLTISDFTLDWGSALPSFFTHGVELLNVADPRIRNFKGKGAGTAYKPIQTQKGQAVKPKGAASR